MEGSKQADIELEYMRGSAFCSGPGSLTAIADDKMDVIDNDKLKDTDTYPSRERRESLRSSWAQVTETEAWLWLLLRLALFTRTEEAETHRASDL